MANPVFEKAIAGIRQHTADVEAEIRGYDALEPRVTGLQQTIAALQAQERELNQTLSELAPQVTAARQGIAEATAQIKRLSEEGVRQKVQILNAGRQEAADIVAAGEKAALALVEAAKEEAKVYAEKVAAANRDLIAVTARSNEILGKMESAQAEFAQMKRRAATFIGAG